MKMKTNKVGSFTGTFTVGADGGAKKTLSIILKVDCSANVPIIVPNPLQATT
jgi:hypothetical protein